VSRAAKTERMQMVRLSAVIERLHATASDPASDEQTGVEAAGQLGRTMLTHIDLIKTALKRAGTLTR